ncbi:hypothetical protein BOVATA_024510 [Babesia ovata]|uniref:Uncharacterized protein n=1 Tax=Babesia ovata TaxID=189622 RepID=A0A2H6KD88_9APIC|nr:uncharacterized protein BOVATA_024510 [Babesia ovata]GBE60958.1 hypothetical protein BOVATA_024510 [Babesia ovata]
MDAEDTKNPVQRGGSSPNRKVTFNRECEVIPDSDEETVELPVEQTDKDAKIQMIVFMITIIFPLAGCILYAYSRNSRRDSPRYIWAYRALQLGTALSVIYSFIICSFLHHYQLQSLKGDVTGFSYTQGRI